MLSALAVSSAFPSPCQGCTFKPSSTVELVLGISPRPASGSFLPQLLGVNSRTGLQRMVVAGELGGAARAHPDKVCRSGDRVRLPWLCPLFHASIPQARGSQSLVSRHPQTSD